MGIFKKTKDSPSKRGSSFVRTVKNNYIFWLLCLPAVVTFILFNYVPMFGSILAFKSYNYTDGILGSRWVGFDNFKFFFASQDALRLTRNTLGYASVFIVVNLVTAVLVALLLFEIKSRACIKTYQTVMILPYFLSWVIVGYIVNILLNSDHGVVNQFLERFFGTSVKWYTEPKFWPVILTIANIWKHIGMNCIMYYAALMGIDGSIYEAATIDGAGKIRQAFSISIPSLTPMMTILTIMAVGNIFRSDFGLFYQVPMDVGALYPTTDVIDTYLYRGLRTGDVGITAAVGLFQSVVGLITVMLTNYIVKKIEPDNAMF